MKTKKQKINIPKYPNGGFGKALDFTKNFGTFAADNALSVIGLDNVIGQDDYHGQGANDFARASNVTGSITKSALPIAGGVVGGIAGAAIGQPMLGASIGYGATKGIQGISGGFNPQDAKGGSVDYMKSQETGNKVDIAGNQLGQLGLSTFGAIAPYLNKGNNGGGQQFNVDPTQDFAAGGINMAPNAEVEKQENSISPNGEFTQYNGPSHERGGIKTNLAPNEIIFSDRLKPKGSKKTFADLNKIYNTNKEDKLIEDKKSNNIQKLTAQLMKEAKMKQSMALFQEQESLKQEKVTNYAKRMGISPDKFSFGGIKKLPKFDPGGRMESMPQDDDITLDTNDRTEYNNTMGNLNMYTPEDRAALAGSGDYTSGPVEGAKVDFNYNSNPNKNAMYGNLLKQAALGVGQNMGNLYDLKRSNTVDVEKYNRVSPELLDPSASLKYNDMQGRMANENIKNASVGNASTYLNNRKDLAINQMLTNNRITQDYANQNASIKNNANYYNAQVGDRETIANLQNQAQARNLKGSAYSNIGQNIMGQYKDVQSQKANDKYNQGMANSQSDYLKVIAAKYPEIMKDPEKSKLFK